MKVQIEADDPVLRQLLLLHLVRKLEQSAEYFDELLLQGVSGELIDLLRSRTTLTELTRIAATRWPAMTVSFDDASLLACFDSMRRTRRDEEIKEYLARNGASTELLAQWFTLARSEADELRRRLSPARQPGRPRLPDPDSRDAIHAAWAELPAGQSEREAYVALHQQFLQLSVSTLYQVIHEHDPVPSPAPARSARTAANGSLVKTSSRKLLAHAAGFPFPIPAGTDVQE